MIVYAAAIVAASFFMLALRALAVPAVATRVVATGREAARVMADSRMLDEEKERIVQHASLAMMRAFGSITARTVGAVAAALVPLALFQAAGVADLTTVGHAMATWQGIALTGVAMTAVYFVKGRS